MAIEMTPNGTYGVTRSPGTLANSVLKRFGGLLVGLYRLLGGRGMRALGAPLLLLTTVGARSGKARVTPVAWFPDGSDSWLVVASAAGAARHPAYYGNLARKPDQVWIEVGRRRLKVQPASLSGAQRDEAWRRIVSQSPGYQAYQDKTDRQIPVIRLTPAAGIPDDGRNPDRGLAAPPVSQRRWLRESLTVKTSAMAFHFARRCLGQRVHLNPAPSALSVDRRINHAKFLHAH